MTAPNATGSTLARDAKAQARRAVAERVVAMSPADREQRSADLCRHLLASDLYHRADTILAFWPVRQEPDLRPLIHRAIADGKTLCLPRTDWATKAMVACAITSAAVGEPGGLALAKFGLHEPGPDATIIPPEQIDLLLIPGVAFDRFGGRLGRGAGFYDRLLEPPSPRTQCRPRPPAHVGVCFEAQLLGRVPTEPHDRPVTHLATELGVRDVAVPPDPGRED